MYIQTKETKSKRREPTTRYEDGKDNFKDKITLRIRPLQGQHNY